MMGSGESKGGGRSWFVLLALLSAFMVLLAYWLKPSFITAIELKTTDAFLSARGASSAPPEVVIIAIDEKSINEIGRWPWPRRTTAGLIKRLKYAKAVGLDIVFSETESSDADRALAAAIEDAGNVVLGFFLRNGSTQEANKGALAQMRKAEIAFVDFIGGALPENIPAIGFDSVETNTALIGRGASSYGAFNAIPQPDGIYRDTPLVFKYKDALYPSLAAETLKKFLGAEFVLTVAPYGMDNLSLNDSYIPLDERGGLRLNFYGPGGSFKTYPASDVLKGRVSPREFEGRLVFVGITETGISDIRPTPLDSLFPGVEIHATVAGSVLQDRYLIRDTRTIGFDLAAVVVLALLLSIILSSVKRTYTGLAAFIILLLAIGMADFALFYYYNVVAGVVYPALALLLTYISNEAYRNVVVEKKSRYLRRAFSTYVSPELVAEIIKDHGRLKLGGEKRVVTVLFSDIRGFTTISEKLAPEKLVSLLNEYLSPMTSIVLSEGGMLDKYIGDAIMAVFNAPVEVRDHPKRACLAALRMRERLAELNKRWEDIGYPSLDIGVGINTGEAVVGNMGAELRFDYTAIGDTVNLASRLEGMNKLYGTAIIISENTYNEVRDGFVLREIDCVKVKGKGRPGRIYELVCEKGAECDLGLLEGFARALSLYRDRRFMEAKEVFGEIERGTQDAASSLYMKRCDEYLETPPPEGWDGVFEAKTK